MGTLTEKASIAWYQLNMLVSSLLSLSLAFCLRLQWQGHKANSVLQELRTQQRNEEDMVRVQQVALQRGTSASGQGGPGLPSSLPRLMQQPAP